jgi:hypothetical protein
MSANLAEKYGIHLSTSAIVATNLALLMKAVDDGSIFVELEEHVTRASRKIYKIKVGVVGEPDTTERRFYIGLPKGSRLEIYEDEKPKFLWKVSKGNMEEEIAYTEFEALWTTFMTIHVEALLKRHYENLEAEAATYKVAALSKSDEVGRFVMIAHPSKLKTEQATSLNEPKGCHVILAPAYFYALYDQVKNTMVYGPSWEAGRFPFQVSVKASTKRGRDTSSSESSSSKKAASVKEVETPSAATEEPKA